MINRTPLLFLFAGLLILSACNQQDPFRTNYYTGTNGIELEFFNNAPPPVLIKVTWSE